MHFFQFAMALKTVIDSHFLSGEKVLQISFGKRVAKFVIRFTSSFYLVTLTEARLSFSDPLLSCNRPFVCKSVNFFKFHHLFLQSISTKLITKHSRAKVIHVCSKGLQLFPNGDINKKYSVNTLIKFKNIFCRTTVPISIKLDQKASMGDRGWFMFIQMKEYALFQREVITI